MKKIFLKINLCAVTLITLLLIWTGCKKDSSFSTAPPVITAIRSYVAHPGDSLITRVGTGQWVVISGKNLKGALAIYFDGTKASFNDALFSDTSAIALIPAVIAFPSVAAKDLNTIRYVTTHGETTFAFPIVAPAPSITGISDESANTGDSVRINGLNFFFIKSVIYAGKTITNYRSASDGTYISLAVPAGLTNTGGKVSVTTNSGTAATVYNVHDFVTGVFQNWDSINSYPWGSTTSNNSTLYPGNTGDFNYINASGLSPGDNAWYNGGRSINMGSSQWVPTSDINASLSSYAVKFEIFVPQSIPWLNGSIYVVVNYSTAYVGLYAPWRTSTGASKPFYTTGWQTVTIPLSNFLTNNGTGIPAASIKDLVGGSGNNGMNIWYMNDGLSTVVNFNAAFDNIRVVKIN